VVKAAVSLISLPMGPGLLASKVGLEIEIISIKFFDVYLCDKFVAIITTGIPRGF
jgi:hypothetical protein